MSSKIPCIVLGRTFQTKGTGNVEAPRLNWTSEAVRNISVSGVEWVTDPGVGDEV